MLYPIFFLLLFLRIVVGEPLDLPLAFLPWIWLLILPRQLPFRNPFFLTSLLLGIYTTVTMFLPRSLLLFREPFTLLPLPPRFALPSWAETELGGVPGTLHLASWEGASWILRFLGGAGWIALFSPPQEGARGAEPASFLKVISLVTTLLVGSEALGLALFPYFSRVNPNHKAAFLLATLPFLLKNLRGMGWLLAAGVLAGIYSTSALFPSFLGTALCLGILLKEWAQRGGRLPLSPTQGFPLQVRYLLLGGALVALVVGAGILFFSLFPASLSASVRERLLLWKETLLLIEEHPLTGIGFGAYPWIKPLYALYPRSTAIRALHPENGYLWFLAEGGLVGVFLLLLPLWLRNKGEGASPRGASSLLLLLCLALADVPWLWGGCFYLLPYLCASRASERGKGEGVQG